MPFNDKDIAGTDTTVVEMMSCGCGLTIMLIGENHKDSEPEVFAVYKPGTYFESFGSEDELKSFLLEHEPEHVNDLAKADPEHAKAMLSIARAAARAGLIETLKQMHGEDKLPDNIEEMVDEMLSKGRAMLEDELGADVDVGFEFSMDKLDDASSSVADTVFDEFIRGLDLEEK
jgi:hypothetical protein